MVVLLLLAAMLFMLVNVCTTMYAIHTGHAPFAESMSSSLLWHPSQSVHLSLLDLILFSRFSPGLDSPFCCFCSGLLSL